MQLTADNIKQTERLRGLREITDAKLVELKETIGLQRAGKHDEAVELVKTDRGRLLMERARAVVTEAITEERSLYETRNADWEVAASLSQWLVWGGAALLLVLIVTAGTFLLRELRRRAVLSWLSVSSAQLSTRLTGDQSLQVLSERLISFIAEALDAKVGAVYLPVAGVGFRRIAGYAMPASSTDVVRKNEGLIGQAVASGKPLRIDQVPPDYLPVTSGLGKRASNSLMVAPAIVDGTVQAVVELGFFKLLRPEDLALLDQVAVLVAVALRTARDRDREKELLEETQRQSEELQTQQEELRVTNEELEEQSRALKESQARLETQQSELEQTNAQLEEQTQWLEDQKAELTDARNALRDRAEQLQMANQHKSEFLANMSHELRTPLNSSLILARLLADNKHGNLSDEQVTFANTIYQAGNDLLVLINDILDLSKIESGKVEMQPESVELARLVEGVERTFRPIATSRSTKLEVKIADGAPPKLFTDQVRLMQVLKNLLSNAFKFTPSNGSVLLTVAARPRRQDCLRRHRQRHRHRAQPARGDLPKRFVRPTAAPTASSAAPGWACRSRAISPACSVATSP